MSQSEAVVILENVRSAHNVGAIFRTAESVGVAKIYLVGYTPAPVDRFGRAVPDLQKTALGADAMVPWEQHTYICTLITELKGKGFRTVAVERTDDALDYKAYEPGDRVAFVFGNEVDGVSSEALAAADAVISLPMKGRKESLNVSVAAGIVLYRVLDR
jgi:tRNA G18 (ribose-2'-O)-methylase SpoU